MAGWPVVARTEELRSAAQTLLPASGLRGVALVGEPGVGKTTLARALAEALESGGHTTRFVLGTETGHTVPLGAFQRILAIEEPHEPGGMLAVAFRELARIENLALVVDDAHRLDVLSALLLHHLAANGTTKLIVTIRAGATVPDAVTALWKERLLQRLDVQPFTRAQTEELVCAVLDGDVDPYAVDHLHRLAAGSPLALRSLLLAAQADGVLRDDGDCWHLAGPLRVSADLGELIGERLNGLTAAELDAVELVSVAELLDWSSLREMCDPAAIAGAERGGAIQLVADGVHLLARPGHPILGEVVRQRCGVARFRELNTQLAQRLSESIARSAANPASAGPDVRARIQLAQFITRSDMTPDVGAVIDAAASAVTMSNIALGEQLAQFAYQHGGGLPAAIVLADALSWQGQGDQAEALLAEFDPVGPDELAVVQWGSLRAANLFFGCGRLDAARSVLATAKQRVSTEVMVNSITAIEVAIAFFGADIPAALTQGLAAMDTAMLPMAEVWVTMATAGALAFSGRFSEVPEIARRGMKAAEQCESGPQRYAIALSEVFGHIGSGDVAAAEQVCVQYRALAAGVPQAEAIVSALAGYVDLMRGRVVSACDALRTSLWTMSESLPRGWVMLVAAWLAQAEGARGNSDAAAAALARAEAANGPQVAVFLPELELAHAWERVAVGETTAARRCAQQAAYTARRDGMFTVEVRALHLAVRFGDRSHTTRLKQLAEQLRAPLVAAVATYSSGLSEHDGDRLDDAADQFGRLGVLASAADAAAHAARAHARAGTRGKELESASRAHWLASQYGLRTPALSTVEDPLPITDREREIASLVAASLTNREIAGRLGVSVRTVDGHLYRIFTKLGIDDRDQLARLVRIRSAT